MLNPTPTPDTRATDALQPEGAPVVPGTPGDGTHQGPRVTALVVSQERVGRGFIVQSLRGLGLHTLVADSAAHALSRLRTGHHQVDALVLVGELSDGTAEAMQRWARANGFEKLPIVGVGVELGNEDLWSQELTATDWFGQAPTALVNLGLLERRSGVGRPELAAAFAEAVGEVLAA